MTGRRIALYCGRPVRSSPFDTDAAGEVARRMLRKAGAASGAAKEQQVLGSVAAATPIASDIATTEPHPVDLGACRKWTPE